MPAADRRRHLGMAAAFVLLVMAGSMLGSAAVVEEGAAPVTTAAIAVPGPVHKALGDDPSDVRPKIPADPLRPFRGLSTWIDTYDTDLTPEEQVRIAADAGVDALYIQTQRPSTEGIIHDPARLATTMELAHDAGMTVMVWSIPELVDLDLDRERAMEAMTFTTPRGDRPDAFGLDIELEDIAYAPVRTRRLLQLSAELRDWAGEGYPMAAIVLPPLQLELNTRWWPDFPYAELARHYDVAIPMSYSSYRGTDPVTTYTWNHDNVVLTRQLAGVADLPVHLAGGIADDLPEVAAFVQAALDSGAIGAGLYDLHTTTPQAWRALRPLSARMSEE